MSVGFLGSLSGASFEKKAILAVIVLALFGRVFMLFVMPDTSLTDALYHLSIARFILENNAIPFYGVPNLVVSMPVPLFHLLVAGFFKAVPVPFTIETARVFPFAFSFLQLFLSFLILRRLFPRNWHFGFAFVAVQPLLLVYGALNYTETLASVFVLLSFFVFWRFSENGGSLFLLLMPFSLAGMALSKETALILVPAFFLAFLFEVFRKRPALVSKVFVARMLYFVLASVLLCSAWFAVNFAKTGGLGSVASAAAGSLFSEGQLFSSPESFLLFPLNFNVGFWNFLWQAFEPSPFGVPAEAFFVLFTIVTFPVLCFLFYGMAKGVQKRDRVQTMVLLCFATSFAFLVLESTWSLYIRILVPMMPLLGISASSAFKELRGVSLRRAFVVLFCLTALYSVAFSSLYALHFRADFEEHLPLYWFIKELPDNSVIAIEGNKARQVQFISERRSIQYSLFDGSDAASLKRSLLDNKATHLAETCYNNPWDESVVEALAKEGFLRQVYSEGCSAVYEVLG